MKTFLLATLLISTSSFASITLECIEYTPEASGDLIVTMDKAAELMEDKSERTSVSFQIANKTLSDGCFVALTEIQMFGAMHTRMKLLESKSNEFCVYDNRGIKPASYGWICAKEDVVESSPTHNGERILIKDMYEELKTKEKIMKKTSVQ